MGIDFGLSEAQEMFRRSVREFLDKECPRTLVREIEDKELDHSPQMYRQMAELGWLGIPFPEEYGGLGGSFLELAIFYEEAGRALLPSPHFSNVVLGGLPILDLGTEEQKRFLLPRIVAGDLIVILALAEPGGGSDPLLLETTAQPQGAGYTLQGHKMFVSYAHLADYLIVVARSDASPQALGFYLVEGKARGLSYHTSKTLGGERLSEVLLQGVPVAPGSVLGEPGKGWHVLLRILDRAKVALAAQMVGGAQTALEMTVEYAKQRVQFGQPIGKFQAIQHKLANVLVGIEGARLLTYRAAWAISQGLPSHREAAIAKANASDAYRLAAAEGIQVHGGYGYMREYDIQLFFRRAKALEATFGISEVQKELVADSLGI